MLFSSIWSFLVSIPAWGWCDIFFTLLVLVGVCGEWSWLMSIFTPERPNDLLPIDRKRKNLEKKLLVVLIIGVAGELVCIPFSLWESSKLNDDAGEARRIAGEANERASTNELAAKKLEIQLNETKTQLANAEARLNENVANLRAENSAMDTGEEFSFVNALKPLAGIQVELRTMADGKARVSERLCAGHKHERRTI
jgi:hypothetical protein